jgi:hypothetical protein
MVLKIGAANGLTLHDIGKLIYRTGFDDTPSVVEVLVEKANKINNLFEQINTDKINLINLSYNSKDKEDEIIKKEIADIKNLAINEEKNITKFYSGDLLEEKISFEDKSTNGKDTDTDSNIMKVEINKKSERQRHSEDSKDIYHKLDSIKCEYKENRKIVDNLAKISSYENIQEEYINLKSKQSKRESLLKRTASEPRLDKLVDSEEGSSDKALNNNQEKQKKKSHKALFEIDSPFNNLFFHNFEQLLIDYINNSRHCDEDEES